MSVRTDVAEHLAEVLGPDVTVIDHDAKPVIGQTSVMVWAQTVEHASNLGHRRWVLSILILTPKQTGGDDDLEATLDDVLEALDLWDYPVLWSTAEYVTAYDTFPAYRVTATVLTERQYPGDVPTEDLETSRDVTPDFTATSTEEE